MKVFFLFQKTRINAFGVCDPYFDIPTIGLYYEIMLRVVCVAFSRNDFVSLALILA